MKKMLILVIMMAALSILLPAPAVLADKSYHTERLPLTITSEGIAAGQTLRNGMVINSHPNGPIIGAVEEYVLNGAKPNTEYSVWWEAEGIGQLPTNFGSTPSPLVVSTDTNGNGRYTYRISRAFQEETGFTNIDVTLRWLFKVNETIVFETDWTHVHLD